MFVLASGSPRRRALLEDAGLAFRVVVPDVDELAPERGDAVAVARANALAKARAVAAPEPVLGADTVVALDGRLFGKPRDRDHARALLAALAGTTHEVVTGVALVGPGGEAVRDVVTRVTMRALTDAELDAYADSGEGMGKAGAYAVQGGGGGFVTRLDGPYDNVVGLPVATVIELLRAASRA